MKNTELVSLQEIGYWFPEIIVRVIQSIVDEHCPASNNCLATQLSAYRCNRPAGHLARISKRTSSG